ncbi:ArsR family transcriptional regulator [Microcoleus sp. Pol12A5]|uniref:ArsR family transcriptional regulator n=1 Tax=Microcoleus sp. Pol12A5 TaxID=3055392 RepID=UPI002FD2D402
MDDTARLGLTAKAKAIEQFMELEASEREWIFPLLNRGVQSSIEIIELIAEKPLTFEEIADEMDMSHHTITQKLNALIDGGYSGLTLTASTAFSWTGRHRKLARHNKKELVEQFTGLLENADD